MQRIADATRGLLSAPEDSARRVMLLLAALFLLLALAVPKPWDEKLERRLQARAEKGETLRPEEHAARLLFWVALGNAAACVAMATSAPLWARPVKIDSEVFEGNACQLEAAPRCPTFLFWTILVLLVGLALWLRWPLATKSLWWDEAWTVRQVVVGERRVDADAPGGEKFISRNWARTAWYYAKPTNHAGFSILSRISNDAWRAASNAPAWAFAEWAVRLPSLLASAGAVVLIGLLGRTLLGGWAGLIAALLLAAHPWFIRYGVDARAFGLNVFFSLAASIGFLHALRKGGSWPPLALHGLASFALLFTFPYNAFLPAAFFIAATLCAAVGRLPWGFVLRLGATNTVAAMVFLQAAAPWVPQALAWTDVSGEDMAGPRLDASGLAQTWSSFLTGTAVRIEESGADDVAGIPSIRDLSATHAWVGPYLWLCTPLFLLVGAAGFFAARHRGDAASVRNLVPPAALLQGAWLLSVALPLAVAAWKQHYYYERYIIYALPGVLLTLVAGMQRIFFALLRPLPRAAFLAPAGALLFLAPLFVIQEPQRRLLQERPFSPARDVAEYLAGLPAPPGTEPLYLGYGLGGNIPSIYDPRIRFAYTPSELLDAMGDAVESGRPLYVFYGYSNFSRNNAEGGAMEAFTLLDDPSFFQPLAGFAGIEPAFYHRVLKYTGKRVDPVDGRR